MTVIINSSGRMMKKFAEKVKAILIVQVIEKIVPKIVTGECVTDSIEVPQSSLATDKDIFVFDSSNTSKAMEGKRTIACLVNEAMKYLDENPGSTAKSIRRFIISQHPNANGGLLKIKIQKYIKSCLTNGAMTRATRSFKLSNKNGVRLKRSLKRKVEKVKKAGNSAKTPKSQAVQVHMTDVKQEPISEKSSISKDGGEKSAKNIKNNKNSKKAPKRFKPASRKPTKAPIKKLKLKKKDRKAINLSLRPNPPHPKTMRNTNVVSVVSNIKIRKLQQPMERSRQYGAAR